MAIIKPNNNTISAITALPAAISTGKVLQVLNTTRTSSFTTTSTSFVDVGLSQAITPSSSSNKVLILIDLGDCTVSANANDGAGIKVLRDSTEVYADVWFHYNNTSTGLQANVGSFHYLDSPSSSSSITYKIQMKCRTNQIQFNTSGTSAQMTLIEVAG